MILNLKGDNENVVDFLEFSLLWFYFNGGFNTLSFVYILILRIEEL